MRAQKADSGPLPGLGGGVSMTGPGVPSARSSHTSVACEREEDMACDRPAFTYRCMLRAAMRVENRVPDQTHARRDTIKL
jgi:hypothetical protein